ncbi:hypothetical protein [Kaistella chaponensis]|uniref:hypothetical protein n=1 Tax=Kaistella chaponensis TaxID=713588 RepID=UPI001180F270|nr:hypothetical protein [Kaistella chaponensis]
MRPQPSPIIVIASATKWSAAIPLLETRFLLWDCFPEKAFSAPRNDVRACWMGSLLLIGLFRRRASSSQGQFNAKVPTFAGTLH